MTAPVLVLCLGNELRADDGFGWRVADLLGATPAEGAIVRKTALSGLHLVDELTGFDEVVLVDAVVGGRRPAGTLVELCFEDLPAVAGQSSHALGLPTSLRLARAFGVDVPRRVFVVAVEVRDLSTMRLGLTPEVEAAVGPAAERVRTLVATLAGERVAPAPGPGVTAGPAATRLSRT